MGWSNRVCDFDAIFSTTREWRLAAYDVYAGINEVVAIAWIYRLYLNLDWLWTMGASARAKYGLQGSAICSTDSHIRYGNLSAAHRRGINVVEDAGDGAYFIGTDTGECEVGIWEESLFINSIK